MAWPLRPEAWDEDTFYGLIEVIHDLVARPRERSWHDYGRCGWHYSEFAVVPAARCTGNGSTGCSSEYLRHAAPPAMPRMK